MSQAVTQEKVYTIDDIYALPFLIKYL